MVGFRLIDYRFSGWVSELFYIYSNFFVLDFRFSFSVFFSFVFVEILFFLLFFIYFFRGYLFICVFFVNLNSLVVIVE